jgi:exonuclease III
MLKYELDMLALQETHITEESIEEITTTDGKCRYTLFNSGTPDGRYAGVGILVRTDARKTFTAINDRLCLCTLELKRPKRKIYMICAYAPTLITSETNPVIRETFYSQLESLIKTVRRRNILIIAGDFNAKTGSAYLEYARNMGMYGKGWLNSNGKELLDLAHRNDLLLTNTIFQHKLAHITTWEAPTRRFTYNNGSTRKNPFRNQIDYILTRCRDRTLITNSRSYSGLNTYTDHRLVKTTILARRIKYRGRYQKRIKLDKLKEDTTRAKYAFTTEIHHRTLEDITPQPHSIQTKWTS